MKTTREIAEAIADAVLEERHETRFDDMSAAERRHRQANAVIEAMNDEAVAFAESDDAIDVPVYEVPVSCSAPVVSELAAVAEALTRGCYAKRVNRPYDTEVE